MNYISVCIYIYTVCLYILIFDPSLIYGLILKVSKRFRSEFFQQDYVTKAAFPNVPRNTSNKGFVQTSALAYINALFFMCHCAWTCAYMAILPVNRWYALIGFWVKPIEFGALLAPMVYLASILISKISWWKAVILLIVMWFSSFFISLKVAVAHMVKSYCYFAEKNGRKHPTILFHPHTVLSPDSCMLLVTMANLNRITMSITEEHGHWVA